MMKWNITWLLFSGLELAGANEQVPIRKSKGLRGIIFENPSAMRGKDSVYTITLFGALF
jgi:hypothetical protein